MMFLSTFHLFLHCIYVCIYVIIAVKVVSETVSSSFQKSGIEEYVRIAEILQGSQEETKDSRDTKFWKQRKVTSGRTPTLSKNFRKKWTR